MQIGEIKKKIIRSDARTKVVLRNIIGNVVLKGVSIVLSLAIIPLTIGYVSEYNYGIWIALSSTIAWLAYFDIGVNNGLRNKLTKSIAEGNIRLAREYVSTTYAILVLIFIPLLIIFGAITPIINWYSLFSIDSKEVEGLQYLVLIFGCYFCLRSIFSTINVVLLAYQRTAEASLRGVIEQLASFLAIILLVYTTKGSLLYLCYAFCLLPLFIVLLFNLTLFGGRYKEIRPSIKFVKWDLKGDLLSLGIKFFVIQIAGVIQFQAVNFIILKFFGPIDVTAYNISFKYYHVLYMLWGLIIAPIWNAITEAKAKNDKAWIAKTVARFRMIFYLFLIISILMLIISPTVYHLWLGDKISEIPISLSVCVAIYTITLVWGSIYVNVLNGLGALNIQFIASLVSPIVFLAMSYLLVSFGLGVESIVISSIIANFNGIFLAPYQYYKLMKHDGSKSNSIWLKCN